LREQACSLTSLDDLHSGSTDAGADAPSDVASDTPVVDASDSGACPPNGDPSLVAYYRFDEGAGTTVHDCSGNGNDGTILTSPSGGSWVKGHVGTAIAVDGTAGCVAIKSSTQLALTSAMTVTAWVNVTQYVSITYIVGKSIDATHLGWRLGTNAPSTLIYLLGTNSDAGVTDSIQISNEPTSTWLHVAATFTNGNLHEYVNATSQTTGTGPAAIYDDANAVVTIGCRADNSSYFIGQIDEVRLYDRALSAVEIATIAAQ
jgi:hypothetical protein